MKTLYQAYYGFADNPFSLTPDPSFLCMTAQHREALSGLLYSVCTRPGLTMLVGEAGTGKTTLLFTLLELLEKRRFTTALCTNPTLTREEFYDLLMLKFGIACPSSLKSRQLTELQEMLGRHRAEGGSCLLIVDEAQRLPRELLEEIRLLLNIETSREKLLQIIVAGQPELTDILGRPDMRQLKQRISCVCRLRPLSEKEVEEYLRHRLKQAGVSEQTLFPAETIRRIYEYTQGIPRLVNNLCHSAMLVGFALEAPQIAVSMIDEAARDLDLQSSFVLTELDSKSDPNLIPLPRRDVEKTVPRVPVSEIRRKGETPPDDGQPVENYSNRQKSLKFFGNFMDRWR